MNELAWKCLGYRRSADGAMDASQVFPKWRAKYPEPPDLVGVTRLYSKEIDESARDPGATRPQKTREKMRQRKAKTTDESHDVQQPMRAQVLRANQALVASIPMVHKGGIKVHMREVGWTGFMLAAACAEIKGIVFWHPVGDADDLAALHTTPSLIGPESDARDPAERERARGSSSRDRRVFGTRVPQTRSDILTTGVALKRSSAFSLAWFQNAISLLSANRCDGILWCLSRERDARDSTPGSSLDAYFWGVSFGRHLPAHVFGVHATCAPDAANFLSFMCPLPLGPDQREACDFAAGSRGAAARDLMREGKTTQEETRTSRVS